MMRLTFPSAAERFQDDNGPAVLTPHYPFDDRLEFPSQPPLDDAGWLIKAGIASHHVTFGSRKGLEGFSAKDLHLFAEDDWYGECFSVLTAHHWMVNGDFSRDLLARLQEVEGRDVQDRVRKKYSIGFSEGDDTWETFLYELAAKHFTPPLSRLWYAANMLSLFYIHRDDLRLGYLWCEYHMRMRYEPFALKHMELVEKNRESGKQGGQGDKKKERYTALNELALKRIHEIAFAKDRDCVRVARQLAGRYDKEHPDNPLFSVKGKTLSPTWFEEWLDHFREIVRKAQLNQHIVR